MSPSPTQKATLLVAAAAVADVVEQHPHADARTTAQLLLAIAPEHAAACGARRLDTRLGVYAASHANTYLRDFADRRHVTALRVAEMTLPRPVAALQRALLATVPGAVDGTHALNLRLLHYTPAGPVIDQLALADREHLVGADDFTRAALAAHTALGTQLPGFAGVRLIAVRVPRASRHHTPTGETRALGACAACTTPRTVR